MDDASPRSSSAEAPQDLEVTDLETQGLDDDQLASKELTKLPEGDGGDDSRGKGIGRDRKTSDNEAEEELQFIENQKELLALQRLDDRSTQLQREGKYTEALECMEKGLVLRQHFFGAASDEVRQACKTVGEMCNLLAMTYLQQGAFPVVLELLKKAEILTEKHAAARAVTLNNFACLYRRQGNLHRALTYLTDALQIESKLDNVPNRADTHLNMCAVLSQLGKHQSALGHAQSALILLHEELHLSNNSSSNNNNGSSPPRRAGSDQHVDSSKLDRIAVLGIAYHNVGVEHEFLKNFEQSLQSYKKGVELASKYLGETHGIVVTLSNSLITAKRAMANQVRTAGTSGDGVSVLPNIHNARAKQSSSQRFAALKCSLKSSLVKKKSKDSAASTRLPVAVTAQSGTSSTRGRIALDG
jgi:tetratricopeptide (TPR) repeat protein